MALQIKGKFIEDSAIDGEKLKLSTGQAVKLVKADGVTEVRLIEIDEETDKVLVDGVAVALEPALLAEIARATQAEADEKTRAETAEAALQDAIDAEIAARAAADTQLSTAMQSALQSEANARVSEDDAIKGRLGVIEGEASVPGSIKKALKDAKDYVDTIIGVTNSAALETFASLQTAMSDNDTATGVLEAVNSVQSALDAVEEGAGLEEDGSYAAPSGTNYLGSATSLKHADLLLDSQIKTELNRASQAEGALSGRVGVLEARLHRKAKFVISQAELDAGFIELAHEAMSESIVASVGRLMIHEGAGEDFTVSVVDGKSRMTFVGNLVDPSEEKLEVGDIIYVKYMNV